MERQPAPELAHDPEAIGGLVPRVVESVLNEDVDRVIGLLGDHEAAALQEPEEVRNEGGVIHTNTHVLHIGIRWIAGDSEYTRADSTWLNAKTGPRRGAYLWTVGLTLFPEEVVWKAPGTASEFVR